ncbi:shikimate kinase [Nitrogeniibacter mangrovi]|uniref:Shikimate kinase n=1 Tax=Nitrogeniibacter mangrovi TaxID=2016596 RepID=A0A6C1AZJ5_9RHOO|nr:shikimate kinase [Nitrogeniibacter mangrovi]QID16791.1 shikimate kinase [Nitrogeniibacter mangrovi]
MVSADVSPAGAALAASLPCIVLVGMMGAGKTTVGRELAKRLGRRFVDSDHEIVARTGVTIPVIFDVEGEAGFRRRETEVIDALSRDSGVVLATGGGAVLAPENRQMLRDRCVVVYLDVPPHTLWERTRHDRNRPLLQVEDPRGKIESLYKARDPFYREVAHVVVGGGRGSAKSMLRKIEKALQEQCAS